MRNRLALTTILTVAPFFGYGRNADAACDPSPASPTFVCTGNANVVTQAITANNANVSTAPGFSVIAPTGNGITVTGDGHLRFTDQNGSTITGDEDGLSVSAAGDAGATPGAVTVTVNSTITGGFSGLRADNDGTGDLVVTADGKVTGQNGVGILAGVGASGRDLTVNTGATSDITGYRFGIDARSSSTGDLFVNTNGKVTAIDGDGVHAFTTGRDLTITTGVDSVITGSRFGMIGRNDGTGDLAITVNGDVTGTVREGVYALGNSTANNVTVTIAAGSVVKGGYDGVEARNIGRGALNVKVYGDVTGTVQNGVWAVNYAGTSATVRTGAQSNVTGYDGIGGRNDKGDFIINANGAVTGTDRSGIRAINTVGANDLKITTGAQSEITGKQFGIYAYNFGRDIDITVNGKVTSESIDGIRAFNAYVSSPTPTGYGRDLRITTGAQSYIRGKSSGIVAHNYGTGDLKIIADGTVIGEEGYGIRALNLLGNGVEIVTGAGSKISGGLAGISARNNIGAGGLTITVNGEVAGGTFGIIAENRSASGDLKIVTGAASVITGEYGIFAKDNKPSTIDITIGGVVQGTEHVGVRVQNNGGGDAIIKVEAAGRVEGAEAGIVVSSITGRSVIVNAGYITATNLMAIDALDAPVEITNSGVIRGRVDLTDGDDRFDNLAGGLFAARSSEFGGGNDVVNNAGLVQAAHGIAEYENVYLGNLEAFNNSGTVSLVDGLASDILGMGPATNYAGNGGKLAVDAFLAPGSAGKSDQLIVFGATSGTTKLVVNLTNPIGSAPNTVGIRVVSVDGTSAEDDFTIEGGVLNAGFFAWDLRRVQDGSSFNYELYTTGLGAGAYEFAAGITGAQDMWQQTTGTLLQRQADLRPIIAAQQVTPVADFAEPVESTPVGHVTPGLWFKAVGGWLDRDADADNNIVLDRKQTVFGGIAGFDFGTENVSGQGDALLFGLFGGYLTSKLTFDSTNSEWTYDGPTLGAYATYLNDAFYADVVVKADFLNIDIDADDLAPDAEADTNAVNIGGQIDAGYKIGFGQGVFIEPQASLSVLHTEIDDIDDIFGGSVEFEDETSVRGRLGFRLGADYEHDGLLLTPDVTASVWQSFTGDNNVTVFAPLTPASDVSDDPGEAVGDVSLGFAVTAPEGWTGFLRGNYQFAADFEAVTGNAGVRYSW